MDEQEKLNRQKLLNKINRKVKRNRGEEWDVDLPTIGKVKYNRIYWYGNATWLSSYSSGSRKVDLTLSARTLDIILASIGFLD